MIEFQLLKRTYPISKYERCCDGYDFIIKHSSSDERKEWEIKDSDLQRIIKEGEKYIYQVAKEGREFKILSLCFSNYAIIRKHIYKLDDD